LKFFDVIITKIFSSPSAFHNQAPKVDDGVPPLLPCLIRYAVCGEERELLYKLPAVGVWQGLVFYVLMVVFVLA
jgi:hypothetical protein